MIKILTFCKYPVYMCFYNALSDIGHNVKVEDLTQTNKNQLYSHIVKIIDGFKPDIVLTVGRPEIHKLPYGILEQVCKNKKILNVYWATEDRTFHQKYSIKIANCFDYIFTPAEECINNYNAIGKPASLLRYGCYPKYHKETNPDKKFMTDIVIAANCQLGQKFYEKNIAKQENNGEINLRNKSVFTLVHPLVKRGYNISIWGIGWNNAVESKYIKGKIQYSSLPVLYSSAKIVLGLEWDNVSPTKTTGRPFEVLGCQAFFLTLRTKALINTFTDKTHLVLTGCEEETIELVDFYLKNDAVRNNIAIEGQKEVYSKHTYHHRAYKFINSLRPYFKRKI